ncbi:MAG: hypothetical protein AAF721_05240 [Myxococcota bacterium]
MGGCLSLWSPAAEACLPDPCDSAPLVTDVAVHSTHLNVDGVVPIAIARRGNTTLEALLPYITVEVHDDLGISQLSTTEFNEAFGLIVWRPAGIAAGAEYEVVVTVDNAALTAALGSPGCGGDDLHVVSPLSIDDGPLPSQPMPTVEISSAVSTVPLDGLEDLVCCDDAMPRYEMTACGSEEVVWSDGHCASLRARGYLDVDVAVSWPDADESVTSNFVTTLMQDEPIALSGPGPADFHERFSEPPCLEVSVFDLARGEVYTAPGGCTGEDVAMALGVGEHDPTAELAAECAGEPYTCSVGAEGWDASACVPWSGGSDDGGDGGSGGDDGDPDGTADDGEAPGGDGSAPVDTEGPSADGGDEPGLVGTPGCACSAEPRRAPFGLLLLVCGLFAVRRRPAR